MIQFGTPNQHTIDLRNAIADALVMLTTGVAFGHLVNLSMATYRYRYPPMALGKGPKISNPIQRKAKRVESFAEPEPECVSALHGTSMLCRTLLAQLHPGALSASKIHAGRPYRPVCGMKNDFRTRLHGFLQASRSPLPG
jgi:hypothetical protein